MPIELSSSSGHLDATDLKLLAILQADASISNIALADKLSISAPHLPAQNQAIATRRLDRETSGHFVVRQIRSPDGPQRDGPD